MQKEAGIISVKQNSHSRPLKTNVKEPILQQKWRLSWKPATSLKMNHPTGISQDP